MLAIEIRTRLTILQVCNLGSCGTEVVDTQLVFDTSLSIGVSYFEMTR